MKLVSDGGLVVTIVVESVGVSSKLLAVDTIKTTDLTLKVLMFAYLSSDIQWGYSVGLLAKLMVPRVLKVSWYLLLR